MGTTKIIAAYEDRQSARRAAEALDGVIDADRIRVGARDDIVHSKIAEQQEEMRPAGEYHLSPGMTKEAGRSALLWAAIGALAGALLLTPIAFIPMDDTTFLGRLAIVVATGVIGGSVVGWLSGGYLGSTVSTKPQAADRGITVAVEVGTGDDRLVVERLLTHNPIRVDRVARDGGLLEAIASEGESGETLPDRLGRAYEGHDTPDEVVDPSALDDSERTGHKRTTGTPAGSQRQA